MVAVFIRFTAVVIVSIRIRDTVLRSIRFRDMVLMFRFRDGGWMG